MLSSLLRPRRGPRQQTSFDSSLPYPQPTPPQLKRRESERIRHARADWTETENDDEDTEDEDQIGGQADGNHDGRNEEDGDEGHGQDEEEEDGDEDGTATALLPIFSAAHLDSIPVYNLTHAIRLIILPRVETMLTWDQLRSPQVSQFLMKPMQQQIRASHFSRATLYALMANCLQFNKEGHENPGNLGTCRTRAMACELLALKLIKEYSTRELIDALSYDFYPLQGLVPENQRQQTAGQNSAFRNRATGAAARISTLEVAIRASAKKLLAHPLVVQQLEAIWAGTIVFHSTADHLHRTSLSPLNSTDARSEMSPLLSPARNVPKHRVYSEPVQVSARRTVTLYDPRDASLFKLSRLRVPRYRQFFSTCSLAILLGLFLAVLNQRSSSISRLEVIFWIWSAGFMLDEVVGFNEQGFSLYLMSFWNTFDVGILLIFFVYYCMRLYGIFLVGLGRHDWNSMAYDVLAANAVLLFPRLFSVLDHYRYFSQLLIAFRLMAVDLVAVFVLIIISCSGFFIAFTMSFGEDYDAAAVAYGLFQMLMGFTPAAWELWPKYNPLGKAILTLFLFICHFLIVTILITVLTNSFMAIVSNANEEHQFVFAVNTISMVKSDALFSYVAPSNLLAWVLTPLRYLMSFKVYVKVNRYVIKLSHFPLLFAIYFYEKMFLARKVYEPTDLVEKKHRGRRRLISFMDPERRGAMFSPSIRVRQESVAAFQKDRALDEVFTLGPRGDQRDIMKSQQTKNDVTNWMEQQEGIAKSPAEQDRSIVDRLERNRQSTRKEFLRRTMLTRKASGLKSNASDPLDRMSPGVSARPYAQSEADVPTPNTDINHQTEDEGDDELLTNDEQEDETMTVGNPREGASNPTMRNLISSPKDYFQMDSRQGSNRVLSASPRNLSHFQTSPPEPVTAIKRQTHQRNHSNSTILFNPSNYQLKNSRQSTASTSVSPPIPRPLPYRSGTNTGTTTPRNNSKTNVYSRSQPRPILAKSNTLAAIPYQRDKLRHRRSSLDIPLDLTSDVGLGSSQLFSGAVPSSFQTQMALATQMEKRRSEGEALIGRIMLARMKTLEEGFADVVKEMRRNGSTNASLVGMASKAGSRQESVDEDAATQLESERRRKGKKATRSSRPGTAAGKNGNRSPLGMQTPLDRNADEGEGSAREYVLGDKLAKAGPKKDSA